MLETKITVKTSIGALFVTASCPEYAEKLSQEISELDELVGAKPMLHCIRAMDMGSTITDMRGQRLNGPNALEMN